MSAHTRLRDCATAGKSAQTSADGRWEDESVSCVVAIMMMICCRAATTRVETETSELRKKARLIKIEQKSEK